MNEWMSLQVEGPTARPAQVTKVLIKTSCAEILNPKDKQKTQMCQKKKRDYLESSSSRQRTSQEYSILLQQCFSKYGVKDFISTCHWLPLL